MAEKFEPKSPETKPETKESKAKIKEEWKEHFGPLAEAQEEAEGAGRAAKRQAKKEWEESFGILAEAQKGAQKAQQEFREQRQSVVSDKTPSEEMTPKKLFELTGMESEEPLKTDEEEPGLKEVDEIEKNIEPEEPEKTGIAEFAPPEPEAVKKPAGKKDKALASAGEEISRIVETKSPVDWDRLIREAIYKALAQKTETQEKRNEKIDSLGDVKKVGAQRLSKLVEKLAYLAALDKLGILGMKKGGKIAGKIAVEGARDLAVIGLSPAAAVEQVGRKIAGNIQVEEGSIKKMIAEGNIEAIKDMPEEERPEFYSSLLEALQKESQRRNDQLLRGYGKLFRKGLILKLIEKIGGGASGAAGKILGSRSSKM